MPPVEKIEQIRNDPNARVEYVIEQLDESMKLKREIDEDFLEKSFSFRSARNEILKYLGAIAGGAAALAPQLLEFVHQTSYFYLGVFFLCFATVVSVTYILSTLEIEMDIMKNIHSKFSNALRVNHELKKGFIQGKDKSLEAMAKVMEFPDDLLNQKEVEDLRWGWLKQMDYAGEYIVFSVAFGLGMISLSLTSYIVSGCAMFLFGVSLFALICFFATFPHQIFTWAGLPIDIIKSVLRSIFMKNR